MNLCVCCLLLLTLSNCNGGTKAPIVVDEIPAETAFSISLYERYANQLHIILLGREADPQELETSVNLLKEKGLSKQSRLALISKLQQDSTYARYQYRQAEMRLLNFIFDPDPKHIETTIEVWRALPETAENLAEIERLRKLQTIEADLLSGIIDQFSLHERLSFNSYYDFVNMGTENFVVSIFQHFLHRYPTEHELEQAKTMVDGRSSNVFFQNGSSKQDFVRIFFSSTAYFEGIVVDLFKRYFYRQPTSSELEANSATLLEEQDFKALQIRLLSSDEIVSLNL